ncbi:MAG: site-2 protease family protein [Novosphingobium sp.]
MRTLAYVLLGFLNLWLIAAASILDLADNGLAVYATFLLLQFIAIVLHEAGHAFAARRLGAKVLIFAAMPFQYDLVRRKFSAMRKLRGREVGGFVSYTWPLGAATHRKETIIAAAGPLANLAAAALAVAMVPLFAPSAPSAPTVQVEPVAIVSAASPDRGSLPDTRFPDPAAAELAIAKLRQGYRPDPIRHFIEAALQVFALLSVGMAVINLVPFDGSDGAKLLRHWRSTRRRVRG